MSRKICYIINPISGARSKDAISNIVARETLKSGIPFYFYPSVANGDYGYLEDILKEEKFTEVVVIGGDGTANVVIDSLKHLNLPFGIIPSGSGNGLAFGAGIPKSTQKAMQIVLDNYTIPVDAFRVNGQFACMLCGVGFDAKVAHGFADQSQRGLKTYINQIFKNLLDAKAYTFKISLRDNVFEVDAFFISVANSNQFGNHFTIAPKASINDGLLDIVIVTEQSKVAMIYNTMMQVGGLNKLTAPPEIKKKKGILYFQTDSIFIHNKSEAPLHIDGEPVAMEKKIAIEIEKSCFNLLVAAP